MNILYLIPARSGSKAIPNKNIVDLEGKPLIAWTIETAKKSLHKARIIVSSDSEEICDISRKYGAEIPFIRPEEFSGDYAGAVGVMRHAVDFLKENDNWETDILVYLQPTSPFRTEHHIDKAVKLLLDNSYDAVVSVTKLPHNMQPNSLMIEKHGLLLPNEEAPILDRRLKSKLDYVVRNGPAVLALRKDYLYKTDQLYSGKIGGVMMGKIHSIDIDDTEDLELVRYLAKQYPFASTYE